QWRRRGGEKFRLCRDGASVGPDANDRPSRPASPIRSGCCTPLTKCATISESLAGPLTKKFTLTDLRAARQSGVKLPMLTCYDFTTARLMQEAGVPMLLVGDSAANVILGHETTLPVPRDFMIEITAAVRRGAPH